MQNGSPGLAGPVQKFIDPITGVRRMAVLLTACLLVGATPARAEGVNLLAQLDPFPGNDRYGDIWGEGDFAYLGSFSGSGVAIIDISDPENPFLAATYLPASGGQFKDVKVESGIGYFASDNGGGLHIVEAALAVARTMQSRRATSVR